MSIQILFANDEYQGYVYKLRWKQNATGDGCVCREALGTTFRQIVEPHWPWWAPLPPGADNWTVEAEPLSSAPRCNGRVTDWKSTAPAIFLYGYLIAWGWKRFAADGAPRGGQDLHMAISAVFVDEPRDAKAAMHTPIIMANQLAEVKLPALYSLLEFDPRRWCVVTGNAKPNYQGFDDVSRGPLPYPRKPGHRLVVCPTLRDIFEQMKEGTLQTLEL